MGGGTTGMAVFAEGQLLHTAQLPIGGVHVTNDIARGLSTPVAHAERLKTLYGSAQSSPDDEREMLPVPMVGEEEHQIAKVPRSMVVNIIRPRLEETFEMVKERLDGSGLGRVAGTRVVLTGGASQLSGAREMASRILGRTVRSGKPSREQRAFGTSREQRAYGAAHEQRAFGSSHDQRAFATTALRDLPDSACGPAFATAVGLLAWAAGEGRSLHDINPEAERPGGWVGRIVNFLRERV
jgi:cell division protein FtsA